MTQTEQHEGWSNFETFHVALFYSNHEQRNTWIKDLANGRLRGGNVGVNGLQFTIDKMDYLEQRTALYAEDPVITGHFPSDIQGLRNDLITSALAQVNYREIIEHHTDTP